jgi:hypothetical protein
MRKIDLGSKDLKEIGQARSVTETLMCVTESSAPVCRRTRKRHAGVRRTYRERTRPSTRPRYEDDGGFNRQQVF